MTVSLTSEQKALISVYREKWRKIVLSTEPRNRDRATEVIKKIYKLIDYPEPKIIFFDSPYALAKDLNKNIKIYIENRNKFRAKTNSIFSRERFRWSRRLEQTFGVDREFTWDDLLYDLACEQILGVLYDEIKDKGSQEIEDFNNNVLYTGSLSINGLYSSCAWYDFCFSELNIEDNKIGKLILEIHKYCGRLFAYPEVCLLFDRPKKLLLDKEGYLHAEATVAIEYADGFSAYAYRGVRIPREYGKLPFKDWQTDWLLNKPNGELRRALIKGIGAKKILQELTSKQIEELQEYTFLDIPADPNIELKPFINKVPPDKQAFLAFSREKWRKNILSTEPIDKEKTAEVVKNIYKILGESEPEIIFYSSLYELEKQLAQNIHWSQDRWVKHRSEDGGFPYWYPPDSFVSAIIDELPFFCSVPEELEEDEELEIKLDRIYLGISLEIETKNVNLNDTFKRCFRFLGNNYEEYHSRIDYCISELKFKIDPLGKAYLELRENCNDIFGLPKVCLIADRPLKLAFDAENELHSEGCPAIEYADGFCVYAYHGVRLPEKYGKIAPTEWQSKWLLSETNAELKRVLIQGIGYDKICQELQAETINTWQEYTLLRIDANIDQEAVYLLKMTCPSTNKIHALRVPPNFTSAREAITWVNWGTDPEEFLIQT